MPIANDSTSTVEDRVLIPAPGRGRRLVIGAFTASSSASSGTANFYFKARNENGDERTLFGDPDIGFVVGAFGPTSSILSGRPPLVALEEGESLIWSIIGIVSAGLSIQLTYEVRNTEP